MKYNEKQKEKLLKVVNLNRETVKKHDALKEKYPVEVEIKDGFYIIESQMNRE